MSFPAICPIADVYEWLPPANIGGPMTESRGLVLHVNAGNGDPYGWWTQPTTPTASSHFQLMKSGQLIQYVRLDTVAWCQVAGSSMWHSIETEGFPDEPLTDAAVSKLAALYAWGHNACGWPLQLADTPGDVGFGWHGMGGEGWGGHFGCPGDARKAQRVQILQLANSTPTTDWSDMASKDEIKAALREVLNEGTANGQPDWARTNKAILGVEQANFNALRAISDAVRQIYANTKKV
jgi:hypothetical protein